MIKSTYSTLYVAAERKGRRSECISLLPVATALRRARQVSAAGRLAQTRVAHELSRRRLCASAADADADSQANAGAYELRPLDALLPVAAGLCFDALPATATARSPRRLVLFHSKAYELLVLQYSLY